MLNEAANLQSTPYINTCTAYYTQHRELRKIFGHNRNEEI
jgi:hypothetical protein